MTTRPAREAPPTWRSRTFSDGVLDGVVATIVGQAGIFVLVFFTVALGGTERLWNLMYFPGLTQLVYMVPLYLRPRGAGDRRRSGLATAAAAVLLFDVLCCSMHGFLGPFGDVG